MEKIIPRWEWRTFGNDLSKGEKNIIKYGNKLLGLNINTLVCLLGM